MFPHTRTFATSRAGKGEIIYLALKVIVHNCSGDVQQVNQFHQRERKRVYTSYLKSSLSASLQRRLWLHSPAVSPWWQTGVCRCGAHCPKGASISGGRMSRQTRSPSPPCWPLCRSVVRTPCTCPRSPSQSSSSFLPHPHSLYHQTNPHPAAEWHLLLGRPVPDLCERLPVNK